MMKSISSLLGAKKHLRGYHRRENHNTSYLYVTFITRYSIIILLANFSKFKDLMDIAPARSMIIQLKNTE